MTDLMMDSSTKMTAEMAPTPFGHEMRHQHFIFAQSYRPLNHGSYGTSPKAVLEFQQQLRLEAEARPDIFIRHTSREYLKTSRAAVAGMLGVRTEEVVFVPNATTGTNTVLGNLVFEGRDTVVYFNTIFGANLKTLQNLQESIAFRTFAVDITYPIEDDEIVGRFRSAIATIQAQGRKAKIAMFDTVLKFPGVRFPWERLVQACKDLGVLSLIDGAHGIGHIDLQHLGQVGPDFFISNCYKWLMVPRGCAILHVPKHNHNLIRSSIPTSWGYEEAGERAEMDATEYFVRLFEKVSTIDSTPYLCVPKALEFRQEVCGGEDAVRQYSEGIAADGGKCMAELLGTEVLPTSPSQACCFTNVRLPLRVNGDQGRRIAKWMQESTAPEYETYLPIKFYEGGFWCRLSGQIYLTMEDFEWAAKVLLELSDRARAGEWKTGD